jgi:hypothetical protein
MEVESDASERATAANPQELPKSAGRRGLVDQPQVPRRARAGGRPGGRSLRRRQRTKLDPTLILAVMAVESSFNPFAQSSVGAQGLMQVMTKIHSDKYESFGGHLRRVRPQDQPARGREGAAGMHRPRRLARRRPEVVRGRGQPGSDGGYAGKVLAEHARLQPGGQGQGSAARPARPAGAEAGGGAGPNPSDDGALVKVATLS